MARSEARISVYIWDEPSFCALKQGPQLLYLFLRSQEDLNSAAFIPLREQRWATILDISLEECRSWLSDLAAAGWVHVDEHFQEVFVSRVFLHENIALQPRRAIAAEEAITHALSSRLRLAAEKELDVAFAQAPAVTGKRARILERDGYRCQDCEWAPGEPYPDGKPRALELDHVWPRARGGGNEEENLAVRCSVCNARKGAKV